MEAEMRTEQEETRRRGRITEKTILRETEGRVDGGNENDKSERRGKVRSPGSTLTVVKLGGPPRPLIKSEVHNQISTLIIQPLIKLFIKNSSAKQPSLKCEGTHTQRQTLSLFLTFSPFHSARPSQHIPEFIYFFYFHFA